MDEPCPCSKRTIEAQNGSIVWRATDNNEWCGNRAEPTRTMGGDVIPGWCEYCVTKQCPWCRHD